MDTIISNFKDILTKKYAKFNGRANLAEYWLFVLVTVILSVVLSAIMMAFASVKGLFTLIAVIYAIIGLGLLLPGLAVTVRRLHDIGKGGGWIFITLVPIIGSIWLLVLLIQKGEEQENRFGSQPL